MNPFPYLKRGKTRRRIRRIWDAFKAPFAVIAIVAVVVGIIVPPLEHFAGRTIYVWTQALISLSVLVAWLLAQPLVRRWTSRPPPRFFERVDFLRADEQTLREAAEGILSTRKALPFYVHAAPRHAQLPEPLTAVASTGLARIGGGPGCGKSLLAYQAAYALQNSRRFRVYRLNTEYLEATTKEEFSRLEESLLFQLDDLPGKSDKLILVDDAHKIQVGDALMKVFSCEVSEGNCKCIWIETEPPGEADRQEYEGSLPADVVRPRLDALLNGLAGCGRKRSVVGLARSEVVLGAVSRPEEGPGVLEQGLGGALLASAASTEAWRAQYTPGWSRGVGDCGLSTLDQHQLRLRDDGRSPGDRDRARPTDGSPV